MWWLDALPHGWVKNDSSLMCLCPVSDVETTLCSKWQAEEICHPRTLKIVENHWGCLGGRKAVGKVTRKVGTQNFRRGMESHLAWIKTCPTVRLGVLSHSFPWGNGVSNPGNTGDWQGRFWYQWLWNSLIQDKIHVENVCVKQENYLHQSSGSYPQLSNQVIDKTKTLGFKTFTPIPALSTHVYQLLFILAILNQLQGFILKLPSSDMFYRKASRATMSEFPLRY